MTKTDANWDYFSDEELEENHDYYIDNNTMLVDGIYYHIKAADARGFYVVKK